MELHDSYPCSIVIQGKTFASVEHAMQYYKFVYCGANEEVLKYAELIRTQISVENARMLSNERSEDVRADYEYIKDNIKRQVVYAKYVQHPELLSMLFNNNDPTVQETRGLLYGPQKPPPTPYCNWVIEGVLLAASNPGRNSGLVERYIAAGINVFISLQQPGENIATGNDPFAYLNLNQPGREVSVEGLAFQLNNNILTYNLPIADCSITTDEKIYTLACAVIYLIGLKYKILIHCQAGKGRTGTLVCIILGLLYGIRGKDSMILAQRSYQTRQYKGRHTTVPQTTTQKTQVCRILG